MTGPVAKAGAAAKAGPAAGKAAPERADSLLLAQGLAASREKAQALIMAGQVYAGDRRIDKAGLRLPAAAPLTVKGQALPFVSRGGLKLAGALTAFSLDLRGAVMLDIGASTGGFTDCGLQNGVARVFAVDVGRGQLDWKLRQDPRVKVLEKVNARYLTGADLGEAVDFVTIDVSFISLDKILPVLPALLRERGQGIALIKPQFEAGREKVGKKGVVREPAVHRQVLGKVLADATAAVLFPWGLTYSPLKGPEGNIEYLLWFGRRPAPERGLRPGQGLEPEPPPAAATASVLTLTPAPDAASLAAGLTALTREAFAALNER